MKRKIILIVLAMITLFAMRGNNVHAANQTIKYNNLDFEVIMKNNGSALLKRNGRYKIILFNEYKNPLDYQLRYGRYRNVSLANSPVRRYLESTKMLYLWPNHQSSCSKYNLDVLPYNSINNNVGYVPCIESERTSKYMVFYEEHLKNNDFINGVVDKDFIKRLKSLRYQKNSEKVTNNDRRWNLRTKFRFSMFQEYKLNSNEFSASNKIYKYASNYLIYRYSKYKHKAEKIVKSLEKDKSFNWLNLSAIRIFERFMFQRSKNNHIYGWKHSIGWYCSHGWNSRCYFGGNDVFPEFEPATLPNRLNKYMKYSPLYGRAKFNWRSGNNKWDELISNTPINYYE